MSDNGSSIFGSADLRYNDTACNIFNTGMRQDLCHLLCTSIQSSFNQIGMSHSETNKRRHSQSSNSGSRAVHGIVADMAMLTIDDDTLYNHQWGSKPYEMRNININAGLSYNLGCAKVGEP